MDDPRSLLIAAIKHRHRRSADPDDRWHFRCSCGLGFTDPRVRDDHVIKANEATWESLAVLSEENCARCGGIGWPFPMGPCVECGK